MRSYRVVNETTDIWPLPEDSTLAPEGSAWQAVSSERNWARCSPCIHLYGYIMSHKVWSPHLQGAPCQRSARPH